MGNRLVGSFSLGRSHQKEASAPNDGSMDAKRREAVAAKAKQLEGIYGQRTDVSEKLAQQEAMSFMRRRRESELTDVNITYPVHPPFAFINIVFDKREGEYRYLVREPRMTEADKNALEQVKTKIEEVMDKDEMPTVEGNMFNRSATLSKYLRERFDDVTELFDIDIEERKRPIIIYYMERELLGFGRSDSILDDPFIEDVSCNGPLTPLFVYHRVFGSMKTNVQYDKELELNKFVIKLAQISGKHISIYQPILDATLTDGSRINLTLGSEVTRKGSTFTVRKFSYDPISPIDLLRLGSVSALQLAYFWQLIENKKSILISGGTASGKTTLLNALCMFIRPEDKIVSIEDTPEIHIDHVNWIQSIARSGYGIAGPASGVGASGISSGISPRGGSAPGSVTLYDLLVAALRQRPEYVIVGEVRGKEAFTLFQAISVGHASMSTIHAGSIDELLHRVENEPMNIPRVLFQSLDAVAFQAQVSLGSRRVRRVKGVTEILEVETATNDLLTNNSFGWDPAEDRFDYSGRSFALENIAKETGKPIDEVIREMRRKEAYLRLMDSKNVNYYKHVSKAIGTYYVDPKAAMEELQTWSVERGK